MNNLEENNEDLLRHYINPGQIEKAPEGFTLKVMSIIRMERVPLRLTSRIRSRNLVPVISIIVTILLIMSALFLSESNSDSFVNPVVNLIKNIKVTLPEIDFSHIFSFSFSASLIYILSGILILTLFDRILILFFHRDNKQELV
jgi:hypothetical protein